MAKVRWVIITTVRRVFASALLCCLFAAAAPASAARAEWIDALDGWVRTDFRAADGFQMPSGRGKVRAIARGRVASVDRNSGTVLIEHIYYDNHEKKRVSSIYEHLSKISVSAGEDVERDQLIGESARKENVVLEPKPSAGDVASFITARKKLFVPNEEPVLFVVDQHTYRMRIYERGVFKRELEIGLGQGKGQKIEQGDLKTPKGMYFVTEKYKGHFPGKWGGYFGGHWLKINYPNAFDAQRALENRWIDRARAQRIAADWRERKLTDQKTRLGGGIGFHGWIEEWEGDGNAGAHLSWGCVVLHLRDVASVYEAMPVGAMVVIM